jgi:sec-independent protein translocase protein TatA
VTGWTSPTHLVLIFLLALLLFGGKRLPEIGRSLGKGMTEFKHSLGNELEHNEDDLDVPDEIE